MLRPLTNDDTVPSGDIGNRPPGHGRGSDLTSVVGCRLEVGSGKWEGGRSFCRLGFGPSARPFHSRDRAMTNETLDRLANMYHTE